MLKKLSRKAMVVFVAATFSSLFSISVLAQEPAQQEPQEPAQQEPQELAQQEPQETTPMQPPSQQPKVVTQSTPEVGHTVVAAAPAEELPYADLKWQPKKLRTIDGQDPPLGYVEIEKIRKGLVISGGSIFGGLYLISVMMSSARNSSLVIPIVGPVIAGFRFRDSDEEDYDYYDDAYDEREREYSARLWGILGTLAQSTGVVLFIAGMSSKKKIWLRRDIAGAKFLLTPTVVGHNDPGLGVIGTF